MIPTKSQNVIKKPMVSTKIAKTTLQYRQNRLELPKNKKKYRKKNRLNWLFHSKSINFEFLSLQNITNLSSTSSHLVRRR